eukprot:4943483-Amphidinium_carterae.1
MSGCGNSTAFESSGAEPCNLALSWVELPHVYYSRFGRSRARINLGRSADSQLTEVLDVTQLVTHMIVWASA